MKKMLINLSRMIFGLTAIAAGCWAWWWQSLHFEYLDYYPEGMWIRISDDPTPGWMISGAQALSVICVIIAGFALYKRGHGGKLASIIICLLLGWHSLVTPDSSGLLQAAIPGLMMLYVAVMALILPFLREKSPVKV